MRDWYMQNLELLALVFGASPVVFVLVFAMINMRVRQQFVTEGRKTVDTPEIALIKSHTRLIRSLSLVGIALQVVLVTNITNLSSSNSTYSFALPRPAINFGVFFLGFMTNTHVAFRLTYMVLLGQILVFDTIAEISVAMVIDCLQIEGIPCGDSALSLSIKELKFFKRREIASLFLTPWIILETAYLCVAIGFCSSRYTNRQLSLSRPTFNLRAALLAHFPVHSHQFRRNQFHYTG